MAAPTYQLLMRSGPTPGKTFPIEKNETFIGRDLTNDIVISDAEISRRHARMVMQAGGLVLEDLGSTNGTVVNGQRLIGPYLLRVNDVITLGEHVALVFEAINPDMAATVASTPTRIPVPASAAPAVSAAEPATSGPTYMPPSSVPSFSGKVPESPAVEVPPARRTSRTLIIVLVVALLVLVCACGAFFWYIDANSLWCIFPFIPGCPG